MSSIFTVRQDFDLAYSDVTPDWFSQFNTSAPFFTPKGPLQLIIDGFDPNMAIAVVGSPNNTAFYWRWEVFDTYGYNTSSPGDSDWTHGSSDLSVYTPLDSSGSRIEIPLQQLVYTTMYSTEDYLLGLWDVYESDSGGVNGINILSSPPTSNSTNVTIDSYSYKKDSTDQIKYDLRFSQSTVQALVSFTALWNKENWTELLSLFESNAESRTGSRSTIFPQEILDTYLQVPAGYDASSPTLYNKAVELNDTTKNFYQQAYAVQQYFLTGLFSNEFTIDYDALSSGNISESPDPTVDRAEYLVRNKTGIPMDFATAMTLMLRIQGIPSRYVVGFSMGESSGTGERTIRMYHYHAWVEVLIPLTNGSFYWVPFAPCPSLQEATEQRVADNMPPVVPTGINGTLELTVEGAGSPFTYTYQGQEYTFYTVDNGDTIRFVANLTDPDGAPVNDVQITFYEITDLNDIENSRVEIGKNTTSNGIAYYNYTIPPETDLAGAPGPHFYVAQYLISYDTIGLAIQGTPILNQTISTTSNQGDLDTLQSINDLGQVSEVHLDKTLIVQLMILNAFVFLALPLTLKKL